MSKKKMEDITSLHEMESSFFQHSQELLCVLDYSGKIVDCNFKRWNEILGWSKEKLENRFLYEFIAKEEKEPWKKTLHSLNNQVGPTNTSITLKLYNHQGEQQWVQWQIFRESNMDLLLAIGKDCTHEKTLALLQVTLAEERTRSFQSAKMASLGEMAGGIAHELNNPLAIIHGAVRKIRRLCHQLQIKENPIYKAINDIDGTIYRIEKVIKSLRTFARDGSKDPIEEVELRSLIEETTSLCQERFYRNGISLTLSVKGENFEIECRSTQIIQVFLNLINNAFDASLNHSEKWVKIILEEKPECIEISVIDSGMGIPKEIAGQIMQPFFTTKHLEKSRGLGLNISSGIVSAHHGELFYDERSTNTRFVVRLPKVQAKEEETIAAA